MPYTWVTFTAYLDGSRKILSTERDELWDALAWLLDQCGGRWQLVGAEIDAIKASKLETDLTVVEDTDTLAVEAGDLAAVLIAIEDTFTGTTGYDAFKAVRAAEGLASDAALAELITEAGRVTRADNWHVWNLYRRVLIELQCEPTPALAITCTSLTATPSFCGVSGFINENAGPFYKWTKKTLAGSLEGKRGTCSSCGGDENVRQHATESFSGDVTYGCAGITSLASVERDQAAPDECDLTINSTATASAISVPLLGTSISADCSDGWQETLTQTVRTVAGCGCYGETDTNTSGSATETLHTPDTIEAAMARETPVEGSSCCAVTGIIGTTTANATAPLSVGETTTAMMGLEFTGGEPLTDYVLRVWFKNYVNSTDVELAETYTDIEITTDVDGEWSDDVAIPQPDSDGRRCKDRYEIDPE